MIGLKQSSFRNHETKRKMKPTAKTPPPEPKRRKIGPRSPPSLSHGKVSSPAVKKTKDGTSTTNLSVPVLQTNGVDHRIQQEKNFAIAQAQQEGATGNFRIFDSPFGNFLVPAVPTRAELSG